MPLYRFEAVRNNGFMDTGTSTYDYLENTHVLILEVRPEQICTGGINKIQGKNAQLFHLNLLRGKLVFLLLRNLVFTVLHPGIVVGLIPFLLVKDQLSRIFQDYWGLDKYLFAVLLLLGLAIMLHCIYLFAKQGGGTLSPADPYRQLVVSGLYRYSCNPMYTGNADVACRRLFLHIIAFWVYVLTVFVVFNLFISFLEEPRLRKDFGAAYRAYCHKVRKWIWSGWMVQSKNGHFCSISPETV
ncbi:MAG: isoprenylcysteine carboxylmethyltransferase family protein [Lewinellaceae bacterium]|nr:isoprenylcysteine carboxylmethyltransferase family protein [Lewinellaceae bacterium]